MHNLSNIIPQCSVLRRVRGQVKGGGSWAAWDLKKEKQKVILRLGSRGGLTEICLLILKGGEIQYS